MTNRELKLKKEILVIKIVEVFKSKYDIEYCIPLKLIEVIEPMLVVDFIYLRKLISQADNSVEIRVNGSKESKIRERNLYI